MSTVHKKQKISDESEESTSKMTSAAALDKAMKAMTDPTHVALYDVTIVCTTDDHQADYWMKRLAEGICKSDNSESQFPMVLAVSEDWSKGGAGNGLGTLYAYEKSCRVAKEKYDINLSELLNEKKVSAALYHTAGKGTRLAPLPASENNNKPGVVSCALFVPPHKVQSFLMFRYISTNVFRRFWNNIRNSPFAMN